VVAQYKVYVYLCIYAYGKVQTLSNRYVNVGLLGKAVSACLKPAVCTTCQLPGADRTDMLLVCPSHTFSHTGKTQLACSVQSVAQLALRRCTWRGRASAHVQRAPCCPCWARTEGGSKKPQVQRALRQGVLVRTTELLDETPSKFCAQGSSTYFACRMVGNGNEARAALRSRWTGSWID
jgi:hypothetical protein